MVEFLELQNCMMILWDETTSTETFCLFKRTIWVAIAFHGNPLLSFLSCSKVIFLTMGLAIYILYFYILYIIIYL